MSLALSPGRDNHPLAATAKMAILIVAAFLSRLSRYTLGREMFVDGGKQLLTQALGFN